MHRFRGLAGLALAAAAAGCASPGEPLHGVAAVTLRAPATDGRVAAPGKEHSTSGRPRSAGAGLSLDLLPPAWILSFRTDSLVLPEELEPAGARALGTGSWELAAGPKVIGTGDFRLDALAGGRAWILRSADANGGLPSDDIDRETWIEPFAGLRVEAACSKAFSLRFRGDASLVNSDADRSWRASAAGVLAVSPAVAITIGWEMNSVQHDRGSGGDRFLYDVTLSGPFLALELRF